VNRVNARVPPFVPSVAHSSCPAAAVCATNRSRLPNGLNSRKDADFRAGTRLESGVFPRLVPSLRQSAKPLPEPAPKK